MYYASRFPSLNSASASRVASSSEAPPAISSRQRSSRCCESSSTMSFSCDGDRRSEDKRGRTCRPQSRSGEESGMFAAGDSRHRLHECRPGLSLLRQDAPPFGRQLVETAAPFVRLLDPRPFDPAALLEAVEQRIQGIDVELQGAARPRLDQLAQVVAMPGARIEQRQNEQLCGSALELAVKRAGVDN